MMFFDARKFYDALDIIRKFQRLDWKDVAEKSGVDAATLSRLRSGHTPSADNLLRLFYWGNLEFLDYKTEIEGGQS
jgi:transcriptional regulator with XRE-family HTH domain